MPFKLDAEANKKFGLENGEIVIWTTTPWTIPSNLGIALNPEIMYVAVESGGRTFVVAEALSENFVSACKLENVKIKPLGKGSEFLGFTAKHPLIDRGSKIINARYVTTESGTGRRPYRPRART